MGVSEVIRDRVRLGDRVWLRDRVLGSRSTALGWLAFWGLVSFSSSSFAFSANEAVERAQGALREVQAEAPKIKTKAYSATTHQPEALFAAADLHLRTGQFREAIEKLNKVVELGRQGRVRESTVADAEYLLGQAYLETGELYSARRQFEFVTDNASKSSYAPFAGRAAIRLVDVALQLERFETLEDVLARVDRLIQQDSSEALRYARAKALLGLGRYDDARAAADGITGDSTYVQRAAYLRGVALMKQAQAAVPEVEKAQRSPDYAAAIASFETATKQVGKESVESREISDFAWLAIARLHFENQRYLYAALAYEKVPRTSKEFARALFELSWTYVRMGDYQRGQRTLEALRVLDPGLIDGADASLLRADLLLRSGRFKEADEAYREVREKYEPLRLQIDEYLAAHEDPATYYDRLTDSEIETGKDLPPLVIGWAREEARADRVFAIVDDVARSRSLVKDSRKRVVLLRAALGGETRAKVFPNIRRELEDVVALVNRLAVARLSLARGMDEEAGGESGELAAVRAERRQLMARLGRVPTNPGDFTVRDAEADKQWNKVSQGLQRLQLESDHLQALVNGLHRVLREANRFGITADASTLERYRAEIEENEKDMALYKERIAALREQVEMGRVQSGFGDERFTADERVRTRFRELLEKEVALVQKGQDPEAVDYARRIAPLLAQIRSAEAPLEEAKRVLDAEARARGEEMEAVIATEAEAMEAYAARLDTMDQHARVLVGEVARDNFVRVRARLKDVVLRSDVGAVQKSWEVRENQRLRVLDLLRERAQEERLINDELREVLDDTEDTP